MKLTGGEIVREYLIKEKVPYFIGIPGHGCLGLVDAFKGKEDNIKVLQVRHEQSAAHLADGHYRASGRPLAIFTSIGPGAINTAVGVATSYVDSTAMLVITGDTHTYMFGRGVLQEIERQHNSNFPRILEPIVKRYWQVNRVSQLPHIMQRAFNYMLTGRPGPVLIDLPMDVQSEAGEVEIPEPSRHNPPGRMSASSKEIEKAAGLLFNAKRPVILAGGGVITSGAWNELKELAEFLGAAVITTMMGKGAFPEDHPLYAWHAGSKGTTCGNKLASSSDVLLAVGCRFADETACSYRKGVAFSIPPTKLIQIDLDPNEIGKNYPVEAGIIGDARETLGQISKVLRENKKRKGGRESAYFNEIQRLKKEWFASLKKFQNPNKVPITVSCFLTELREFLERDAFVVSSSGNAQAQILQEFPFYEPKTFITSGGFSTMGFSLPAALGVKLAHPERQVIAIVGDGDFLMTIQELATAVQYNIPVVTVVLNNVGWQSIKDLQIAAYGEDRVMATDFVRDNGDLYTPDFTAIAKGFGVYAKKIERPSEVKDALKEAFASGKPAVIEAMANRQQAYSGVVAGWWDVPIPAYLSERRAKYEREKAEERLI
ncbi:MAG: thiamine pyrophosphate-binding protein [Clostridia bacterium]|jgi:acetolactate synthase-1/2/3 large subunit|nr:thiamine pyrophosphate-binding protein [Clostridia bacterium]